MIFLTVGTQLKFDRLVRTVDGWALTRPDLKIFGQIGDPGNEGYCPLNFEWQRFVEPSECNRLMRDSLLVIAHAGMGSIIGALTHCTPIVVMPRRKHLGEHRTDHQLGTVRRFAGRAGIVPAMDETELVDVLTRQATFESGRLEAALRPHADQSLIDTIREFIQQDRRIVERDGAARDWSIGPVSSAQPARRWRWPLLGRSG